MFRVHDALSQTNRFRTKDTVFAVNILIIATTEWILNIKNGHFGLYLSSFTILGKFKVDNVETSWEKSPLLKLNF